MLRQLMTAGAVAICAAVQPLSASGATRYSFATSSIIQPAGVITQLLAHRTQLSLDEGQVRRLKSLAADARRQDSDWYYRATRCESSKPWLKGPCLASVTQVKSAALAILTPDQRTQAVALLNAAAD
jgi:hypothetical protein